MTTRGKGMAGWVMLCIAIALWGVVIYAYTDVEYRKKTHLGVITDAQQQALQEMSSSKLRGFMVESEVDRRTVEEAVMTDIVNIVEDIESAGTAAGLDVEISGATPEKSSKTSNYVEAVVFTIQAQGSYAGIARFLTLLNSLPAPVYTSQFDIVLEDADARIPIWRTNIRAHTLTASRTSL